MAPHLVSPERMASVFVISGRVDCKTRAQALERIVEPPGRFGRMIHFAHAHCLNVARRNESLRGHLAAADDVFPDGAGLRLAGRLLGFSVPANLNGTDLLPDLCSSAAVRGIPLCLVGAAPGVAAACAQRLKKVHAGLAVPIVVDGFRSHDEYLNIAEQIRDLGRCIVLVGMGTPLQERWAWRYLGGAPGTTVVTVGGLFDFFSGRVPRAPQFLRSAGLEWTYRLWQEPRRMARRYLAGNPLFVLRVLKQRIESGGAGSATNELDRIPHRNTTHSPTLVRGAAGPGGSLNIDRSGASASPADRNGSAHCGLAQRRIFRTGTSDCEDGDMS